MSTLSLVIACRHSDYYEDHLTDTGKEQAQKLAEAIQQKINGASGVFLATSPVKRAVETAEIIGKQLGIVHSLMSCLIHDASGYGSRQMESLLEGVANNEIIVAVTHYEAPAGIVDAFLQKRFQKSLDCKVISKGSALCLSLNDGNFISMP